MAFRIQLLSPAREWITTGPSFATLEDARGAQAEELERLNKQPFCGTLSGCRLAVELKGSDLEIQETFGESLVAGIFPITGAPRIEDLDHVSFLGRFAGPDDYSDGSYTEEFPEWIATELSIRDLEAAF